MKVGKGTKIWHEELSNIHESVVIGNNCRIHSHVWIGENVRIGNNVKIQAFVFIPTGVTIGDDVFIGPHVCFTNDKMPPSSGSWIDTRVAKGVSIGANATILPGIVLGNNCKIGAGAVVTKTVIPNVIVCGNPAKIHNKK